MTEALQLWKKIAGKAGDGTLDEGKASGHGEHLIKMVRFPCVEGA